MLLARVKENSCLVAILFVAGIFLFTNLGNQYLWMDEGETAVLARSILKTGFPRAWDGKNLMIVGWSGLAFNDDLVSTLPWLQYYLTSLSFLLFGENNWSARGLPALLGLFTVFFLYLLTYKITSNKAIGLLAAFLLSVSIPFILYMRQCKYYALLACFSYPLIYAYYKMPERKYTFLFFLFSIILFFSNYLSMAALWVALAVYFFMFDFSLKKCKHLLFSVALVIVLSAFWIFSFGVFDNFRISGGEQAYSLFRIENIKNQVSFLLNLNMTVIPLSLLFIGFIIFFFKRNKIKFSRLYFLLLVVISLNIVLISFEGRHPERYAVGIIPLFYVLMAVMCYEIFVNRRILRNLFILMFLSTNIFNEIPAFCGKAILSLMPTARDRLAHSVGSGKINPLRKDIKDVFLGKKYYLDFFYEITHDYDGPIEGIVEFLNHNVSPGDMVVTPYGQNSIMFYVNDKDIKLAKLVGNKEHFLKSHPELKSKLLDYIFDYADLDWLIPRTYWPGIGYTEEDILRYIETKGWRWTRFEIPYPDIMWNNRPEIRLHYFKTAKDEQNVVIYKVDKQK